MPKIKYNEESYSWKIKNEEVIEIRQLNKQCISIKEIAKKFNISVRHIRDIIKNKYRPLKESPK